MPFYGVMAIVAFSISIAVLGSFGQYAAFQSAASSLIASYTLASRMESVSVGISNYYSNNSINATKSLYNISYFGGLDGFNLSESNDIFIINSRSTYPKYYLIRIK